MVRNSARARTRQRPYTVQREAYFTFRDKKKNLFFPISCFETRTRIYVFKPHWKSNFSRREREYLSFNLAFWDKTENIFLSVLCFKTRARNEKFILKVEQEKMKLILKRILTGLWDHISVAITNSNACTIHCQPVLDFNFTFNIDWYIYNLLKSNWKKFEQTWNLAYET